MDNINEDKKIANFSSKEMAVIEWILIRTIDALQENPNRHEIKGMIQDYFVDFCYEKNYSVKEVFDVVYPLIKKDVKIEFKDIIPESKKGQERLVSGTFAGIIRRNGAIWDEEETENAIDRFCGITGISKEFVVPRINNFIKHIKREFIETEVVEFLQTHIAPIEDKNEKKEKGEFVINEFSQVLDIDPKYIKEVLREKKKKEDELKKKASGKNTINENVLPDKKYNNEER